MEKLLRYNGRDKIFECFCAKHEYLKHELYCLCEVFYYRCHKNLVMLRYYKAGHFVNSEFPMKSLDQFRVAIGKRHYSI